MKDEIVSYREMCDRENVQTLQRDMNYRMNPNYSVILMSQRKNAPYQDKIHDDGFTIEYEGHDIPKTIDVKDPKEFDEPKITKPENRLRTGCLLILLIDINPRNHHRNLLEFMKNY